MTEEPKANRASDIVEDVAAAWDRIAMERELADAATKLVEQLEEIKRLRAALEPFSKALKGNWSHQPDEMKISAGWENGGIDIRLHFTLGDFRRATAAMEGK